MGKSKWLCACALVAMCALQSINRLAADEEADNSFSEAAAYGNDQADRGRAASSRDAEARIEQALDGPLQSPLDFVDTPLSNIMQIVAEEYGIPIQFDEPGLEEMAQSSETEVTANIRNVSLRSALELILRQADGLTFVIDKEVLLITTQEEAESRLITRVYRIDDLLPIANGRRRNDSANELGFTPIVEVITRCVARESWALHGTGEGEICVVDPGVMVITQTQRAHGDIARLLATVRRVKGAIDGDVPVTANQGSEPVY